MDVIKNSRRLSKIQRRLMIIKEKTELNSIEEDASIIENIIKDDLGHSFQSLKMEVDSSEKLKDTCYEIADILESMQSYGETNIDVIRRINECMCIIDAIYISCT